MMQLSIPIRPSRYQAISIFLGLAAVGGWGIFAVSTRFALETERQLRGQVASLQEDQTELLSERNKSQAVTAELARLRKQAAEAHDEIVHLSQGSDPSQLRLPSGQPAVIAPAPMNNSAQDTMSQTGSIGSHPPAVVPHPPERWVPKGSKKPRQGMPAAGSAARASPRSAAAQVQHGSILSPQQELDKPTLGRLTSTAFAVSP
jgi:hypothetical protein